MINILLVFFLILLDILYSINWVLEQSILFCCIPLQFIISFANLRREDTKTYKHILIHIEKVKCSMMIIIWRNTNNNCNKWKWSLFIFVYLLLLVLLILNTHTLRSFSNFWSLFCRSSPRRTTWMLSWGPRWDLDPISLIWLQTTTKLLTT